jgi:hypothetical protein
MISHHNRLIEQLRSEMEICQTTAARLAAKADSSEDESKARFSSDLLEAIRDRRGRVQEQLAALRSLVDRAWQRDVPRAV